MDDTELALALAADLDRSFEALVRGHADRVYSIALRLTGDAHDAEEVAQDAFVRAYRALGAYDAPRIRSLALRPWLATIAVNAARSRRRRPAERVRPVALDAAANRPAARRDQPEPSAVRRAERERLAAMLADLPDRYRAPIVLRYVDDFSISEIAQVLGRPEGTVKAQVHRGLALLRAAHEAAEREELSA